MNFLIFSVLNTKYLTFDTHDTNSIGLFKLNIIKFLRIYLKGKKKFFGFGFRDRHANKWREELGHGSGTE